MIYAGINRKGKSRPYILHPIEAMTIVGSLTDDEAVLAAAVLHDTVEDTPATIEDIEREFGRRVAELVNAESEDKRPGQSAADTWTVRKQETIDHLKMSSRDAKLICLGDKLANLRELARDYAALGEYLWERFNQKDKAMHGWYYRSIFDILVSEFGDIPALAEYKELLKQV